jgi:hypothetical protein
LPECLEAKQRILPERPLIDALSASTFRDLLRCDGPVPREAIPEGGRLHERIVMDFGIDVG